ncbi:MAG: hypothetical protein RLZZ28_421 [Bacteroidota bacterium]|jgi:cytidine deaminase
MDVQKFSFEFEVYNSIDELTEADALLLSAAKKAAKTAYAPYSEFLVGAAAILSNGEIITGTNQENASYPVGLCAERVLLSAASSFYPNETVVSIAISYRTKDRTSVRPITPCGICRQTLMEYQTRYQNPIRLILGGMEGKVHIIPRADMLLPFGFTGDDLKC